MFETVARGRREKTGASSTRPYSRPTDPSTNTCRLCPQSKNVETISISTRTVMVQRLLFMLMMTVISIPSPAARLPDVAPGLLDCKRPQEMTDSFETGVPELCASPEKQIACQNNCVSPNNAGYQPSRSGPGLSFSAMRRRSFSSASRGSRPVTSRYHAG
jgi:hypothetical protein